MLRRARAGWRRQSGRPRSDPEERSHARDPDEATDNLIVCRVQGVHLRDEPHKLAAIIDARVAKYAGVRCLVEIADVEGVDLGALREGLCFDLHHGDSIERCAVVGDRHCELAHGNAEAVLPHADVRFFELAERADALERVRERQ